MLFMTHEEVDKRTGKKGLYNEEFACDQAEFIHIMLWQRSALLKLQLEVADPLQSAMLTPVMHPL